MRAQGINRNLAETMTRWAWEKCEQPPVATHEFTWEEALEKLAHGYKYDEGRSEGYEKAKTNGDSQGHRQMSLTSAADIAMEAIQWLWEDECGSWIPMGQLSLLGGREGVGKTTICADLIGQLTRGELLGDLHGKPKAAIIASTEDDWKATIKPRLVAAGADLSRVYRVNVTSPEGLEDTLSLPDDLSNLEKMIPEHDVALVVLDPLLSMISGKLDTHKDAEIRIALRPLIAMAQRTGVTLLGLIHVNKSNEGDLSTRVMGSRALTAVPRAVLFAGKYQPLPVDEDDEDFEVINSMPQHAEFVLGQIKNNLGPKIMQTLRYHMETEIVGHDERLNKPIKASRLVGVGTLNENVEDIILAQEKARKGGKTQTHKATAWLVGYLSGKGEVPSKKVIADGDTQAGLSRTAIQAARRQLGDRIKVVNLRTVPKQTTWQLLEESE